MKKEKKINFSWDNDKSESTIIFRKMLWDDPVKIYKQYGKNYLKSIFLKFYYKFDKRNRNFWQFILKISDDEINQSNVKNIKRDSSIWDNR